MSHVVIIGGNERMEQEYQNVCLRHNMKAKIYTKDAGKLAKKIGQPELIILFTGTVAHKMLYAANREAKKYSIPVLYVNSSSKSALDQALVSY